MFKIKLKFKKIKNTKKGMTLVIALTTMTLLLSVSLSISNIVLRQIKISSMNDKSKIAFFAADSAMGCAMYYDTLFIPSVDDETVSKNQNINTAVFGKMSQTDRVAMIKCGNQGILNHTSITSIMAPETIVTSFDIDYGDVCARVEVTRTDVGTSIMARGYNTDATSAGCNLTNIQTRRLVERGLTIKY
jgi:Tfp pilus assembly protein PilX